MAKKRVHELAKLYDLPSKEVIARLEKAGVTVKAAASAVDEGVAEAAIKGKPLPGAGNGKAKEAEKPAEPAKPIRPSRIMAQQQAEQEALRRAAANGNKIQAEGDKNRQRPTRSSMAGERAPGTTGGMRRVVIDSQAARRGPGGPGGPGGGPGGGPPRRPPRRGRRRRGTYVEPEAQDKSTLEVGTIRVNSGSTVKDVGEYLGVPVPDIIKKLMQLGEMATLTQTLSDDAIQVIADEFEKDIEIVHAADEVDAEPTFDDDPEDLVDRPPSSRSWATSTTARRRCSTRSARRTSSRARPAASPSTSAPTRCTTARRRSPSSTRRATRRSPPCAPAAPR
jgi:translation initiation factor IF-2